MDPIFLDVDLDGYEDLLISNGHLYDVNDMDTAATRPARQGLSLQETRQLLLSYPRLDTPKAAFRNRGDLTFEDVSEAWGFNSRQIAHGMALADLDLDGDLDVIMNCLNAPPLIYRNDSPACAPGRSIEGKSAQHPRHRRQNQGAGRACEPKPGNLMWRAVSVGG